MLHATCVGPLHRCTPAWGEGQAHLCVYDICLSLSLSLSLSIYICLSLSLSLSLSVSLSLPLSLYTYVACIYINIYISFFRHMALNRAVTLSVVGPLGFNVSCSMQGPGIHMWQARAGPHDVDSGSGRGFDGSDAQPPALQSLPAMLHSLLSIRLGSGLSAKALQVCAGTTEKKWPQRSRTSSGGSATGRSKIQGLTKKRSCLNAHIEALFRKSNCL